MIIRLVVAYDPAIRFEKPFNFISFHEILKSRRPHTLGLLWNSPQ